LRGGTAEAIELTTVARGLSPLARGNHRRRIVGRTGQGVYPRLRGGTLTSAPKPRYGLGLSPLARGNRRLNVQFTSGNGSIPACAGEPALSY